MHHADRQWRRLAPLLAATCLALGGCQQSLSHSDFLTEHTGDAVAANNAIQVVDPWKRESFDTRIPNDAARIAGPANKYRTGEAPPAAAPARTVSTQ